MIIVMEFHSVADEIQYVSTIRYRGGGTLHSTLLKNWLGTRDCNKKFDPDPKICSLQKTSIFTPIELKSRQYNLQMSLSF